jgi:hypothetical protein
MLNLVVNGVKQQLDDRRLLNAVLASVEHEENIEIWASFDDGKSLCALLNRTCGWLMYLRFPEDTGFSSRNPALGIDEEGTEIFILGNGQADVYPRSWTLERPTVFAAILGFVETGDMPSGIHWNDDRSV